MTNQRFGYLAAVVVVITTAILTLSPSTAWANHVRVGPGVYLTEASELPNGARAAAAKPSEAERTPRIVGGTPTTIQNWPWQIAVTFNPAFFSGNAWDRQFCGGSLVSSTIFITAAHCFYGSGGFEDPSNFAAVSGRTRLTSSEGQETPLATYYVFTDQNGVPLYDDASGRWDVLVAELPSSASGSPIQIAGPDELALWIEGRTAYVTGWGRLGDGSFPDDLQVAQLAISSDGDCAAAWPIDFYADVMVCAFAAGRDTCAGDSGGPLVVPTASGQMRLVGNTSGGADPCGQVPGVYGRLADDPIRSTLQNAVQQIAGVNIVGSGAQPPAPGAPPPPPPSNPPPPPSAPPPQGLSRQQALNLSWRLAKRICYRFASCRRYWAGRCQLYGRSAACWIQTLERNRRGRKFNCARRVRWRLIGGRARFSYMNRWMCYWGWQSPVLRRGKIGPHFSGRQASRLGESLSDADSELGGRLLGRIRVLRPLGA